MSAPAPRFIPNTPSLNLTKCANPRQQLQEALTHIIQSYHAWDPNHASYDPEHRHRGLFRGPMSVAFLFLRLGDLYGDDLIIEGKSTRHWLNEYLSLRPALTEAAQAEPKGITDDLFCYLTIKACSVSSDGKLTPELELACKWATAQPTGQLDDFSNEWMNGRGGTLYLLRVLKYYYRHNPEAETMISNAISVVLDRIYACPRPWKWHNTPWIGIGAVHGITGVITQVMLSARERAKELQHDVEEIIDLQREDGMWGVRIPDEDSSGKLLCQLCHGPPGVVLTLLTIRPCFPELKAKIDIAIEKGRKAIWELGILTKEPCLCHGVSGNALALDWDGFEKFLSLTTVEKLQEELKNGTYVPSDDQFSLYCGEAGRAWCWAVADKGVEMSGKCIGWNDL